MVRRLITVGILFVLIGAPDVVRAQTVLESGAAMAELSFGRGCRSYFSGAEQVRRVRRDRSCKVAVRVLSVDGMPTLIHTRRGSKGRVRGVHRRMLASRIELRVRLKAGLYSTLSLEDPPIAKNTCGDGICAEVVCQMVGCPQWEDEKSCPLDCGAATIT